MLSSNVGTRVYKNTAKKSHFPTLPRIKFRGCTGCLKLLGILLSCKLKIVDQPLQPKNITTDWLLIGQNFYVWCLEMWSCDLHQALKLNLFCLQIEEFRRLRSHVKGAELLEGNDGLLGDNFRPTQPLSDRTVRAAFQ